MRCLPSQSMAPTLASRRPARRSRECFAACVAHELRTPLATQRVLLELALADPDADVETWRATARDVLAGCRRQERVLEACLTLARSLSGLERRELVDLAAVAAAALEAHDPVGLDCVAELAPAWTNGNPDLLERLADNLVSNAIRHNVAGGRIEVASGAEADRAVLSVVNTGPPIPDDDVTRIFLPFQRLGSSPRSFGDGVGLGLAVVEAIAEAHAARVSARARAGGGLAIDVAFPALD